MSQKPPTQGADSQQAKGGLFGGKQVSGTTSLFGGPV